MTRTKSTPEDEGRGVGEDGDHSTGSGVSRSRKVVYAVVVLVVFFAAIELLGQFLYSRRTRTNTYMSQPYFRNRDWGREYLEAQYALKLRYEPYVGWRRTDCRTRYLNVIDGERQTVHPSEPSPEAVRIWCFGGSTMWGTGVRDVGTIPSHLARIAQEAGFDVRVRNLGEPSWVATQETIFLALKVRQGEKPDIAIFYDGINDVFAGYQSGRTDGVHHNLSIFEDYFRLGYDPRRNWRQKSAIYLALARIRRMIFGSWRSAITDDDVADDVAAKLAETYLRTMAFNEKFGVSCGFEVVSFWQPTIVYQPDYEQTERYGFQHGVGKGLDRLLGFYQKVSNHVRGHGTVDLTHCLGPSPPEGYFIDRDHLNEEGNAVVAGVIFEHLRDRIAKRSVERVAAVRSGGVASLEGSP